jgi:hypothetical protein
MDNRPGIVGVRCQYARYSKPFFGQVAELDVTGLVTTCEEHRPSGSCNVGNAGERTPTFAYGRRVTVGPFTCQVLHTGVKCTVMSSGKGFVMRRTTVRPVGGATTRPAPLHLSNFLSPDRKVWCGIGEGGTGNFYPEADIEEARAARALADLGLAE